MDMLRAINRKFSFGVDAGVAQVLIYGVALLTMVLGIRKVAVMQLSEEQLFFGVVLMLVLTVQMVILGTIVGLRVKKP